MAKVSSIEKNKRRRQMAASQRSRRQNLKALIMNRTLPAEERFAATLKLASLPRNAAANRIRNRCELSGRPHGYYRLFKLSRIAIRELCSVGQIPGLTKSSW